MAFSRSCRWLQYLYEKWFARYVLIDPRKLYLNYKLFTLPRKTMPHVTDDIFVMTCYDDGCLALSPLVNLNPSWTCFYEVHHKRENRTIWIIIFRDVRGLCIVKHQGQNHCSFCFIRVTNHRIVLGRFCRAMIDLHQVPAHKRHLVDVFTY